MSPVSRGRDPAVPASSHAYSEIRSRIVDGQYAPGQLLGERRLADDLKMSRTPVRDALRRLEVERLVETKPRQGVVVKTLDVDEVVELYEVREALEGMAARLAALRASPTDIAEMERLIEWMEQLERDGAIERLSEITGAFHLALYRSARNRRLFELVKEMHDHVRRTLPTTLAMGERHADAVAEHRSLFEAVKAREADRAEQLARQHRQNTRDLRVLAGEPPRHAGE